jgi:hypothetical protein
MHGNGSEPPPGDGSRGRELKPRAERRKLPLGRGATLLIGGRTHIVGLSDLSGTGAYLVTGAAAAVGDELVLQLFLLSGGSGLALRARVVRVVPGGQEQDHHRRGLAVEFLGVDEADRARLESYVRAGLRR